MLVAHIAQRTELAGSSLAERGVARLDLGMAVLIAVGGAVLHLDNARRRLEGAEPMPWRAAARRTLALLVVYWAGLVVALVVGRPGFGLRQLLGAFATLPPWRETRVPGYGQGWVLGLLVLASLGEPLIARVLCRSRGRLGRSGPVAVWGTIALVGFAIRVGTIVLDAGATGQGPLVRLPAHLHLLALGGLAVSMPSVVADRRARRWAIGVVLAAFAIAVALVDRAPGLTTGTRIEEVTLALLGLLGAAGVLELARHSGRPTRLVAWGAAALVGGFPFAQAMAELVMRQYVERRTTTPIGIVLSGAWTAPLLWSIVTAAAFGLAATVGAMRARGSAVAPTVTLAGVVAGSFVLRVVALLTVAPPKPDGGDPLFYHTTANLLAHGRGFIEPLNWIAFGRSIPSALHGPAYPLYLSMFSRLGATTIFDHRLASILAGTGVVLVAGLLGRRVAGDRVMVLAAVLAALYPNLWIIDGVLFPEGLFALCSGLVALAAYRWLRTRRFRDAALMGVLIGVAAMVRGEGLFLSALLVAPLALRSPGMDWKWKLRTLAVAAIGVIVALGPWTVRNATTFDAFVSLSTNGDELNVYANCEDTYSGKYLGFWLFDCQERIRRVSGEAPGDEAERAKYWRDVGWTYAREHASELPKVVAARIGRQWELFRPLQNVEFAPIEGRDKRVALAGLLSYYALVPVAGIGVLRLWRRRVPQLPLLAQFLSVTVTAAYAYGTVRFRAPAELSLVVLAAVGLAPWARSLGRWWAPTADEQPRHDASAFVTGGRRVVERSAKRSTRLRSAVAMGGLAVLMLAPLRGLLRTPGAPMEEGFMLTFPERVMKGAVPNVDFLHLYGPGSLHALAAVYSVFGVRIGVERMFGFGQHAALVFGLYVLLRPWGRVLAGISAGLAITLIVTPIGLDALAWTGALALGVWSLVAGLRAVHAETRDRGWAIASGVLAGAALDVSSRLDRGARAGPPRAVVASSASVRCRAGRGVHRSHPDVVPLGSCRDRFLDPGHGVGPCVRAPGRPHAAPAAELGSPRWCPAGHRREVPAVVGTSELECPTTAGALVLAGANVGHRPRGSRCDRSATRSGVGQRARVARRLALLAGHRAARFSAARLRTFCLGDLHLIGACSGGSGGAHRPLAALVASDAPQPDDRRRPARHVSDRDAVLQSSALRPPCASNRWSVAPGSGDRARGAPLLPGRRATVARLAGSDR